jgi:hypothetical protein
MADAADADAVDDGGGADGAGRAHSGRPERAGLTRVGGAPRDLVGVALSRTTRQEKKKAHKRPAEHTNSDNEGDDDNDDAGNAGDVGGDPAAAAAAAAAARLERARAKKRRKEEERRATLQPELAWPPEDPTRGPVKLSDLRDLVLWVLADGVNVRFLSVRHKQQVERVVYVMVSGLSPALVRAHRDCLTALHGCCGSPAPSSAPGEKGRVFSPLQALLQCPLSREAKAARAAATVAAAAAAAAGAPTQPRDALLLSAEAMRENNYPVPPDSTSALEGYVRLDRPSAPGAGAIAPMFGVDCEMVSARRRAVPRLVSTDAWLPLHSARPRWAWSWRACRW